MKKILLLLLSLTMLLSLNACTSNDTKDKLQENVPPITDGTTTNGGIGGTDGTTTGGGIVAEKIVSIYSSELGLKEGIATNDWGTLSTLTEETNYDGKAKVYKVVSGNGWGGPTACIAFKELGDFQATYKSITFKIKSADLSTVTVKIPEIEKSYPISSGTDLGNGWYELTIPFSDFAGTVVGTTEIGIHCGWGNVGTFYITDVVLTKK